jgi:hypothetical protein
MINQDILTRIIEINRAADDILADAAVTREENDRSVATEFARLSTEDSKKTEKKFAKKKAEFDEKLVAELEKIETDKKLAIARLEDEYEVGFDGKAKEIAQKVISL